MMMMMMIPLTSSQYNLFDMYLLLCIQYWTPDDDDPTSYSQDNLNGIYLLLCIQYWTDDYDDDPTNKQSG